MRLKVRWPTWDEADMYLCGAALILALAACVYVIRDLAAL